MKEGLILRRRFKYLLILTCLALTAAILGYYRSQMGGNDPSFSPVDIDGNPFQLSDFKGKVVVLDFMATWCGPCGSSMPGLKRIYEEFEEDIVMISISVDPVFDTEQKLRDWVELYDARWMHARDLADPPLSQVYEVTGTPTFVILDENGDIIFKYKGWRVESKMREELLTLFKE
jgi:thiol-disulfide isomerase/thioredoxin